MPPPSTPSSDLVARNIHEKVMLPGQLMWSDSEHEDGEVEFIVGVLPHRYDRMMRMCPRLAVAGYKDGMRYVYDRMTQYTDLNITGRFFVLDFCEPRLDGG